VKLYGNPGMIFAGAEKEIKVPADIKGLSLRTPAGLVTQFVKAAGGNPVPMGPPDIQENINKNVLQGFIFEPAGITNFKLQEVTKFFTDFPIYDGAFALVFNQAKWDALPDDYKAAIEQTAGRDGSLSAAQNFKDAATAAHDTIASVATWVELDDAQKAEWTELAKPIQASYTDTIKDKIADPQAYFDDALATIATYNK
jgi:TRAP-type C4-dicarboxylate transport system substrate-binding protein